MNIRNLFSILLICLTALAVPATVHAVEPDEILKDPKLEKRARNLSAELRCLVCQNQSIDDSNAPLAKDLRVLVRERLTAGDTDTQVIDYVVSRYGEFVLLRPRFAAHTLLLWFSPFIFLLIGLYLSWKVFSANRPKVQTAQAKLTPEEEAKLKKLMEE